MAVRVVGFDGDDTLWHSETRFHVTQAEFRELLARHAPGADIDTRLAEMEMKNLAIYGYGVKSFTLSMLETAIELTKSSIPATDLEVILGWGKRMLMEPTELLDGVEPTLRALSERYDMLLITKGDLFDQESKLARSGLGERERLDSSHAPDAHGHQPRGHLVIGNLARREGPYKPVDLGGRVLSPIALARDDLERVHAPDDVCMQRVVTGRE